MLFSLSPEPNARVLLRAHRRHTVDPTPEFIQEVRALAGDDAVVLRAAKLERRERPAWQRR